MSPTRFHYATLLNLNFLDRTSAQMRVRELMNKILLIQQNQIMNQRFHPHIKNSTLRANTPLHNIKSELNNTSPSTNSNNEIQFTPEGLTNEPKLHYDPFDQEFSRIDRSRMARYEYELKVKDEQIQDLLNRLNQKEQQIVKMEQHNLQILQNHQNIHLSKQIFIMNQKLTSLTGNFISHKQTEESDSDISSYKDEQQVAELQNMSIKRLDLSPTKRTSQSYQTTPINTKRNGALSHDVAGQDYRWSRITSGDDCFKEENLSQSSQQLLQNKVFAFDNQIIGQEFDALDKSVQAEMDLTQMINNSTQTIKNLCLKPILQFRMAIQSKGNRNTEYVQTDVDTKLSQICASKNAVINNQSMQIQSLMAEIMKLREEKYSLKTEQHQNQLLMRQEFQHRNYRLQLELNQRHQVIMKMQEQHLMRKFELDKSVQINTKLMRELKMLNQQLQHTQKNNKILKYQIQQLKAQIRLFQSDKIIQSLSEVTQDNSINLYRIDHNYKSVSNPQVVRLMNICVTPIRPQLKIEHSIVSHQISPSTKLLSFSQAHSLSIFRRRYLNVAKLAELSIQPGFCKIYKPMLKQFVKNSLVDLSLIWKLCHKLNKCKRQKPSVVQCLTEVQLTVQKFVNEFNSGYSIKLCQQQYWQFQKNTYDKLVCITEALKKATEFLL